jgi:hypothetical protein
MINDIKSQSVVYALRFFVLGHLKSMFYKNCKFTQWKKRTDSVKLQEFCKKIW